MRNAKLLGTVALTVLLAGCVGIRGMPPQYVVVRFPEERVVSVDGAPGGVTNKIIHLGPGTHTFALEGAADYEPESQRLKVTGTTSISPMEVIFEKR